MIVINPKDESLLRQVAQLHRKNINQGFLSSLGDDFLMCLYKAISFNDNSILVVHIENEEVVGFASATLDITEVKNQLKALCRKVLFKVLIKLLLNPIKFYRLLETYRYSKNHSKFFDTKAELLSISVKSSFRRRGIGKNLYFYIMRFLQRKGVKSFKIIVGQGLVRAREFYEKMGAKKIGEFELHKGKKSIIYIHSIFRT